MVFLVIKSILVHCGIKEHMKPLFWSVNVEYIMPTKPGFNIMATTDYYPVGYSTTAPRDNSIIITFLPRVLTLGP